MAEGPRYPSNWTTVEEQKFRQWYNDHLKRSGMPANFDINDKLYNSREAFRNRKHPLSDEVMADDHPHRFRGNADLKTGRLALQKDMEQWRKKVMGRML